MVSEWLVPSSTIMSSDTVRVLAISTSPEKA